MTNLKLIFFLIFFYFLLAGHRIISEHITHSHFISAVLALAFYFGGIFVYQLGATQGSWSYRIKDAIRHMRVILPFIIPFLLIVSFDDVQDYLSNSTLGNFFSQYLSSNEIQILISAFIFLLIIGIFVIFPYFTQMIWKCEPLTKEPLKSKLEDLCRRANFKHAGFKVWTVMNNSVTAAILGIVPRYRYVIFTQSLLDHLPDDEVEAVLAHEMGHTLHKHLLIYPFIILGGVLLTSFLSIILLEAPFTYLDLQGFISPSPQWETAKLFILLIFYAVVLSLYFRFVFGYFSRLFERQADLTAIELGLPAESMIKALDTVGVAAGNIHQVPSWHHYSIEQRINLLKDAARDPQVIPNHAKKIKRNLLGFTVLFLCVGAFVLANYFPTTPGFKQLYDTTNVISDTITNIFTNKKREQVAEILTDNYHVSEAQEDVYQALKKGLQQDMGSNVPGLAEFYAAEELETNNQIEAAAWMIYHAWEKLPLEEEYQIFIPYFNRVSYSIDQKLPVNSPLRSMIQEAKNSKLKVEKHTN
jgi:STE24 endopeptidase